MITRNDIMTLLDPQIRQYISLHLNEEPSRVALSLREHGALIATQIKYLQRSRTKLPAYYRAQCIIPPLAFEQCSSEESAAAKHYTGETCLDLTCGLGVDSLHLSKHFKRVIAVERDPVLSEITRANFHLLGAGNISVVNAEAEAVLAQLEASCHPIPTREHKNNERNAAADTERMQPEIPDGLPPTNIDSISQLEPIGQIDLIYIDPARRDEQGHKVWLLEDCSPDVIRLMPRLLALSPRVVVKASPLFDVEEAFRLFRACAAVSVEVVSVHGECKEVLIELTREQTSPDKNLIQNKTRGEIIRLTAAGRASLCFDRKTNLWVDNDPANDCPAGSGSNKDTSGNTSGKNRPVREDAPIPEDAQPSGNTAATIPDMAFLPSYLLIPDVTLYKSRLVESYAVHTGCTATSATGYCFGNRIPNNFLGKAYRIREAIPYQPKKLKQLFKQSGIARCNILKKDFPQDADTIAKALGICQGGTHYAAFSRIGENLYAFLLDAETPLPAENRLHG